MGRLIDEDDVLNVLCRELCHPGVICPDGYCEEIREKLKDVPTAQRLCYGYDLKSLLAFAIACRRAGVENDDLKQFALNCEFAWKTMQDEFSENIREALSGMIGRAKMEDSDE